MTPVPTQDCRDLQVTAVPYRKFPFPKKDCRARPSPTGLRSSSKTDAVPGRPYPPCPGGTGLLPARALASGRDGWEHCSHHATSLLTPDALFLSDSKSKKVDRRLLNRDVVLKNRHPTLHKPSIIGHIVKAVPNERTIRMRYANRNIYDVEFDGDVMNMHLSANEVARAEAKEIAKTDSQYLLLTTGKSIGGSIYNHLVMGVWLTNRDTMFMLI